LARTMSSKEAKVDERVDFEVFDDVKVGDVVIIERGAMAIATVTEAHPKRRMGRAGKLHINIDYVRLANGENPRWRRRTSQSWALDRMSSREHRWAA